MVKKKFHKPRLTIEYIQYIARTAWCCEYQIKFLISVTGNVQLLEVWMMTSICKSDQFNILSNIGAGAENVCLCCVQHQVFYGWPVFDKIFFQNFKICGSVLKL